jgi:hypothetical protein
MRLEIEKNNRVNEMLLVSVFGAQNVFTRQWAYFRVKTVYRKSFK